MAKLNLSGHKNTYLESQGFVTLGLQVDLKDGYEAVYAKVVAVLAPLAGEGQASVVLPGLAPLAAIVTIAVHSLTGTFPIIVPLARGEDGQFSPTGENWDAHASRNQTRPVREGVLVL